MTKSSRNVCTYLLIRYHALTPNSLKLLNKIHYKIHKLTFWDFDSGLKWKIAEIRPQIINVLSNFFRRYCFPSIFAVNFQDVGMNLLFGLWHFDEFFYEFVRFILFLKHRFSNLFHRNLRNSFFEIYWNPVCFYEWIWHYCLLILTNF